MITIYNRNGFTIREAKHDDIDRMKNNLRDDDIREIWASDNHTPEQALMESFKNSVEKFTIENQGEIVGMFGVVPITLMDDKGIVWLLSTNEVEKSAIKFLRASKEVIRRLLDRYKILINYVDARHKKAIKWILWCGAKLYEPQNLGIEQMPFHYFQFGGR